MGTNYYWYDQPGCHLCGRDYSPIHIGKSSAGWCFALHVIPEKEIKSLTDWIIRWNDPRSIIKDEYGRKIQFREMLAIVTKRQGVVSDPPTQVWLDQNHAEQGPCGLVRSRIGCPPGHCVGHDGMCDLIEGEFS